ncbi:MFS transporter [Streptomyces huiliensis]|uniref:MFS transporter n=1 Tax=Streptomyces huiliensis TaxID=2876027 RepID=UPI001CBFF0E1|nr:MFS transporter [Streptomyces huiliensis]
MTSVGTPPATAGTGPSSRTGWPAVLAVALGIFSLMTSELLPVGLLTAVASDLDVSEGTAGLMVTVPGLVAAVSAPLVTVATGRVDRRLVLGVLIGTVGAANLASAFAPDITVVLIARFLIGVSVGGFWAIAGGIAVRLVPERHVGRATAVIFGGVEAASVLGVPTGTLLGDLSGWRTAFAVVGVLGLAALACMLFLLPPLPAERTVTLSGLPRLLRSNGGVRAGIAVTFLIVTGHFVAYTFVRPVLVEAGVAGGTVGVLLLVFGAAGITGNFVAGSLVTRHTRRVVIAIGAVLAAAMAALAVLSPGSGPGAGALLVLWGLGYGAVPVGLQTWVLKAAPEATEAASSVYVSVFNLSIALGALLGGLAVDGTTAAAVLWAGAGLTVLASVLALSTPRDSVR